MSHFKIKLKTEEIKFKTRPRFMRCMGCVIFIFGLLNVLNIINKKRNDREESILNTLKDIIVFFLFEKMFHAHLLCYKTTRESKKKKKTIEYMNE